MRSRAFGRDAFTADRRQVLDDAELYLSSAVNEAIAHWGDAHWYEPIIQRAEDLFDREYNREAGNPGGFDTRDQLAHDLARALEHTSEPGQFTPEVLARYVATATENAATVAATADDPETLVLEWITMHDDRVRSSHQQLDGAREHAGAPFHVDGVELRYPGDTTAPIEYWINCRCLLRPDKPSEQESSLAASGAGVWDAGADTEGAAVSEPSNDQEVLPKPAPGQVPPPTPIPWYGVLAPEGVHSGDKRRMAKGSMRHRNLPLRLTYQKASDEQHKGSVVVGKINKMGRKVNPGDSANHIRATGEFLNTPDAGEAIHQAASFGNLGVSVDLDDVTAELDPPEEGEDGEEPGLLEMLMGGGTTFTDGRICSAAICTIPAFPEAVIYLGEPPEGWMDETEPMDAAGQPTVASLVASGEFEKISEKAWDGSASRFTPEQWKMSCCVHVGNSDSKSDHKLPIREPDGTLSRAGVHAAASRIGSVDAPANTKASAKRQLRAAYEQLGEQPPDSVASVDALEFADDLVTLDRGPGWVTDPKATERIHAYWTEPGQPGFEDIAWGTDGDFERCLVEMREHMGDKAGFAPQTCAQWQHDAIGIWPGKGEAADAQTITASGDPQPTFNIVASGDIIPGPWSPPKWVFENPGLTEPTFTTIEDYDWGSHVFGHCATWDACHSGFEGICIPPPKNFTGYQDFHSGAVYTTDGPVKVGQLTLGGGHADTRLGMRAAKAHYDDVAAALADICIGEDNTGIWFSGYLRPSVTDQQRYELLAHKLSGDWRDKGGMRELIAVCCVNVPGFAVKTTIKDGVQVGLVAAAGPPPPHGHATLDSQDVRRLVREEIEEREAGRARAAQIRAAVAKVGLDPVSRMARAKERMQGRS